MDENIMDYSEEYKLFMKIIKQEMPKHQKEQIIKGNITHPYLTKEQLLNEYDKFIRDMKR